MLTFMSVGSKMGHLGLILGLPGAILGRRWAILGLSRGQVERLAAFPKRS
jgi:hypothetical protein